MIYDPLEIDIPSPLPSPVPASASTITCCPLVHRIAVIPLVMALQACGLVRISDTPVPCVVLAPLSIIVHAALILVVASIFTSLTATRGPIRGAQG